MEINSSSLVELKAELSRKRAELTNSSNVQRAPVFKNKKNDKNVLWSQKNKGVEARSNLDLETKVQELNAFDQSRKMLQLKAKMYEKMTKSNDITDHPYLVDFEMKNKRDLFQPENKPSIQETIHIRKDDDNRKCLGHLAVNNTQKEKRELATEKHHQSLEEKESLHYADVMADEVRTHGVGFFEFATSDSLRDIQLSELQELRKQTKEQRAQQERIKERKKRAMEIRMAKVRQRSNLQNIGDDNNDNEIDSLFNKKLNEEDDDDDKMILIRDDSSRYLAPEREWDKGKKRPLNEFDESSYMVKKQAERNDDFAPPSSYKESSLLGQPKPFKTRSRLFKANGADSTFSDNKEINPQFSHTPKLKMGNDNCYREEASCKYSATNINQQMFNSTCEESSQMEPPNFSFTPEVTSTCNAEYLSNDSNELKCKQTISGQRENSISMFNPSFNPNDYINYPNPAIYKHNITDEFNVHSLYPNNTVDEYTNSQDYNINANLRPMASDSIYSSHNAPPSLFQTTVNSPASTNKSIHFSTDYSGGVGTTLTGVNTYFLPEVATAVNTDLNTNISIPSADTLQRHASTIVQNIGTAEQGETGMACKNPRRDAMAPLPIHYSAVPKKFEGGRDRVEAVRVHELPPMLPLPPIIGAQITYPSQHDEMSLARSTDGYAAMMWQKNYGKEISGINTPKEPNQRQA